MRLFGQHIHAPILILLIAEFAMACLAFALSASLLPIGADVPARPGFFWAVGFGAAVVLGLTAMGLYQARQRLRIEGVLVRVSVGIGVAAILLALVAFFFPVGIEGGVWASSFVLVLVLLSIARVLFWKLVDHEAFQRNVLVYGAGDRAGNLLKLRRRSDQRGFRIVGFVPAPGDRYVLVDVRTVTLNGSILDYARELDVNEIVVAMDDRRRGFPIKELLECKFAGIAVVDLLAFLERETGALKVDLMNPAWLIFSEGFTANTARQLATRALDLSVAIVVLTLALPVMALVAATILLEDGRPVRFRQQRVGLMGEPFTLYKFRSMVKDAEADGEARWADAADARVTRVGRVIRKLRLDELPQLLNVIRGDMSLVGPRPERPEFVERLSSTIPYYHERHSVKPGITGWAQLSYPYGSSEHDAMEKLQYDLYYVKHRSLIFDLMVLVQTAEVVLWGKGAR